MRLFFAAAILGALAVPPGAANAQGYDHPPTFYNARRDFSYQILNGAWLYGRGVPGVSQLYFSSGLKGNCFRPKKALDCFFDGDSAIGVNTTDKTQVLKNAASSTVLPVTSMLMHPPANLEYDTIVFFVTPKAGTYRIQGFFEVLDTNPTGIEARIFVQKRNVTEIAFGTTQQVILKGAADAKKKKPGERRKFDFVYNLFAGSYVQFAVGAAGNHGFDSTGFDATITPVPDQ